MNFFPLLLLFKILFKLLPLDEYILLLQLEPLTDNSYTVPALECVHRTAEQILILENQFCPVDEKILKRYVHNNMRTYFLFVCGCVFCNKYHFYLLFMLYLVISMTGNDINTQTHTLTFKSFLLSQALSWRKWTHYFFFQIL